MLLRGIFRACILLLLFYSTANAQILAETEIPKLEQAVSNVRGTIEALKPDIRNSTESVEKLNVLRLAIEAVRQRAVDEALKINQPLADTNQRLKVLGEPSAQGPETPAVVKQRRLLTEQQIKLASLRKQTDDLVLEADQILSRIASEQRGDFFKRILKSDRSILHPKLWIDTTTGTLQIFARFDAVRRGWWNQVASGFNAAGLLIIPLGIAAIVLLYRIGKHRYWPNTPLPEGEIEGRQWTPISRLWRVFLGVFLVLIAFSAIAVICAVGFEIAGVVTPQFSDFTDGLFSIGFASLLNFALAWQICAPSRPEARLVAIDGRTAKLLPIILAITTFASGIGQALAPLSNALGVAADAIAGQSAVISAVMIVLLGMMLLLLKRQSRLDISVGGAYYLQWVLKFFPVIWMILGVAALALLGGYLSFSYFLSRSLLDTFMLFVVFALLHYFADAIAGAVTNTAHPMGRAFVNVMGFSEKTTSRFALVFRTCVDVFLVLAAIASLLVTWTVTWIDFSFFANLFNNGITIGSISLSPVSLLLGLIVLLLGVAATRAVSGWLQRRVLAETSLDSGVQDSVRTGFSYFGYIVAAAFGLSVAGLNFSNLALIAGALGVGIGFGLQSIVNNFVSGLILLAERPVRVGDWVATTAGEGIVKKINVRSTEIETFDNCTIIVPNSNLITEAVRNWTHRDRVGRFNVHVTVPQNVDPEKVLPLLKSVCVEHSKVLRFPEPQVQLVKFGQMGHEYDVKCHVADVFDGGVVASEIRVQIAKLFQKQKIPMAVWLDPKFGPSK